MVEVSSQRAEGENVLCRVQGGGVIPKRAEWRSIYFYKIPQEDHCQEHGSTRHIV